MASARKIITTDDGSSSIYDETLRETYHSTHGAIRESRHVFIEAGLAGAAGNDPVRILEIGFGTGLNVLLATEYAHANGLKLEITSLEAFPLDEDLIAAVNYPDALGTADAGTWFRQIHNAAWNEPCKIGEHVMLTKVRADWHSYIPAENYFNLVFYDAFAPSKQMDMWTFDLISKACTSLSEGGIFVTYSARGQLKRDLRDAGMNVETMAGPPGKKEMVRATRA